MAQYRKKPVVIEAFRFQIDEVMPDWFADKVSDLTVIIHDDGTCHIATLEGVMKADKGDYVIKGINGELYPCKPNIFEKTYDSVNLTYKDIFVNAYKNSTKSKMVVAVKLPTGIEIIVNTDNLDGKMEYYKNAYNDDMRLKANESIEIINYMFV